MGVTRIESNRNRDFGLKIESKLIENRNLEIITSLPHFTHHSANISTFFDSAFYFPYSAFRNSAFYRHPK